MPGSLTVHRGGDPLSSVHSFHVKQMPRSGSAADLRSRSIALKQLQKRGSGSKAARSFSGSRTPQPGSGLRRTETVRAQQGLGAQKTAPPSPFTVSPKKDTAHDEALQKARAILS